MPHSVNAIFGQNLRQLCQARGTLANAARALDISRVQLSRYLNGESFPKPAQLEAICRHFGVDGRIYTQPLAALGAPTPGLAANLSGQAILPTDYAEQAIGRLPEGLHISYRRSFTRPDWFVVSPVLLKRQGNVLVFRSADSVPSGLTRREYGPLRDRLYQGAVLCEGNIAVITYGGLGAIPFLGTLQISLASYVAFGHYRGVATLHREPFEGEVRRVPYVLQTLPQKAANILPAMRTQGMITSNQLPARYREALADAA